MDNFARFSWTFILFNSYATYNTNCLDFFDFKYRWSNVFSYCVFNLFHLGFGQLQWDNYRIRSRDYIN